MEEKSVYDITVVLCRLSFESTGPLFDRYTVSLAGQVDRRWVACYNRLGATPEYARFRLDPGTNTVSFSTRSTDGPVQVMAVLKKLEALVDSANRQSNREIAPEPQTKTTAAPQTRPRLSALIARLGLTRS